jgi:kumamolisin
MKRKSSEFCRPYIKVRTHDDSSAVPGTAWSVPALCAAYNWPTGLAGGGVIALIELGGGWVQSDMVAYFQSIGQPMPQITDISVDGRTNNPNQPVPAGQDDPDGEVAMDIQVAAASYFVATGKPAVIRVYWTDDTATAMPRAVADGCDVCSISWGSDEASWGASDAEAMEAAAIAATSAGMAVFAAAGDNDSGDGSSSKAMVDLPAACPHVVGCGGTFKTTAAETVWNNTPGQFNGQGTGGGYSMFFPTQPYQLNAPPAPANAPAGKGRMVPDVAGNADPNSGYITIVHGAQKVTGGTSAVAPLYAGLFAALGRKLGFVAPKIWQNQHAFNNITSGSNGVYSAGPGPNPCSGVGSPNGQSVAALFVNS